MMILNFLRNHARTLMTLICLFTIITLLGILWMNTRQPTYEGSTLIRQISPGSLKCTQNPFAIPLEVGL
ncbi:hypothetical protein [Brotaphodocola sp.]|uniref:hypothetical protein n=1 Tax=Brotaphodocola sp. TaxID=3073577 RepID=UPI003D7DB926